jgi:nondiscriminating aspartyl-tRNA synthetase
VKAAKIKDLAISPRDYELQIEEVTVLSEPSEYPHPLDISKKELKVNLDTNFDYRPLTLRHPQQRSIFKISACINASFGEALSELGFTQIVSPKLVFSGAEGGSNVFSLEYFGKKAYLAQSPQFYKQIMVGVFSKVYEKSTVFRAEKHNTSRHLNEYYSLDYEMQISESYEEIMHTLANVLDYIFGKLQTQCAHELALLEVELPSIKNYLVMKFDDVHETVFKEFGKDFRGDNDLSPEEERLICSYAKSNFNTEFVFVTHYPSDKRPFYTMDDPEDPSKTLSFDLLFRGLEITTGGQRLHKYEDYVAKMNRMGLSPKEFESYLQTFKYGMPTHGGCATGLERITALICNKSNVKEASLFPRDVDRLTP